MECNLNILYAEVRHDLVRYGTPKLVPVTELEAHYGFRSMYEYDCVGKAVIDYHGHTRGLDIPVYSTVLFVDFDNNKEAAQKFYNWLHKNEIAFEVYDSGGRSIHFHIDIIEMYGRDIHLKQKAFIKQYASGADLSIYKLCGIFRLVGTYHSSGGRKKLLAKEGLFPLVLDNYPIDKENLPTKIISSVPVDKESFFERVTIEESNTGRRPHLFKVIASGVEIGKSFEEVANSCWIWNQYLAKPPLDLDTLESYVKRTYIERIRRCNNEQNFYNCRSGFI